MTQKNKDGKSLKKLGEYFTTLEPTPVWAAWLGIASFIYTAVDIVRYLA